ncbi:MAG TPA: hypothetical protein VLT59_15675 [Steroidobacteraceae bacterium]|nr:hypothetical protein [Steroidobacteraceae bacterium]
MTAQRAHTRRSGVAAAALAVAAALVAGIAQAAESRAQIDVRVAVPRHSTIVEALEPACLEVRKAGTASAIQARAAYRIRSTSRQGVEFVFAPAATIDGLAVRIVGTTGLVAVPSAGGEIALHGHPPGETLVEIEYRIDLTESAGTACVGWPVAVDVRPL